MTLGLMSTGQAGVVEDLTAWTGVPGRDEFFWMSQINKATLLTNCRQGLLTRAQAAKFGVGVKEVQKDAECSGNPRPKMYIRYEPLLVRKVGLEVTLMHAGRSSQDMHATFQRAILRDETLRLMSAVNSVCQALVKMAHDNKDVLLPCYTNGVAAQPSNFAHVLLAHAAAFERDYDRIKASYDRLNECPMGACVLNGTGWPLDRAAMASYLGFACPVENTFDAGQVAGTDIGVEAALVLVHPMLQICQFIAELMQQYAQPHPWILVTSTYASSAMPQKRNPGPLIDIRRDASTVLANLNSVMLRAHNIPTGMYDAKDEKINREIVSDASCVIERFANVLGLLKVDRQRALEELNRDWTASQELADVLMRRFDIVFRVGHTFASRMVGFARTHDLTPKTFPIEEACRIYRGLYDELKAEVPGLPAEFPLNEIQFREVLDPAHIVTQRAVAGGPQPEELGKLFVSVQNRLQRAQTCTQDCRNALQSAQERLENDFEALIGHE